MKFLLLIFFFNLSGIICDEESGSGGSGSGESSGKWVEPSSGMLGDEIMPLSSADDDTVDDPNTNETLQKRGKIAKARKLKPKIGSKRFWQYIHPYYHWINAQQQVQKPLEHYVPPGQCLDENSLCDIGHDEQCCGFASYCVEYWGIGKCLAYRQPDIYDKLVPARIHRNNMYKAYMKKMGNMAMGKR